MCEAIFTHIIYLFLYVYIINLPNEGLNRLSKWQSVDMKTLFDKQYKGASRGY